MLPSLFWLSSGLAHIIFALIAGLFLFMAARHWPRTQKGRLLKAVGFASFAVLLITAISEVPESMEVFITVSAASLLAVTHVIAHFSRGEN